MPNKRIVTISQAVARVNEAADQDLCATFTPTGADEPWIQVVPGLLNLFWPFEASPDDQIARHMLPADWKVEYFQPGLFATLTVDTKQSTLSQSIDDLFEALFGLPEDQVIEVQCYVMFGDDIPERITIAHEPGYHTDHVGHHHARDNTAPGCYMGFVVQAGGVVQAEGAAGASWYVVVHRFSSDGAHQGSDIERFGEVGDAQVVARAQQSLVDRLGSLGTTVPGDIDVALFSVEHDGVTFGLVDASWEDEDDATELRVELIPNGLLFAPPWGGQFDA